MPGHREQKAGSAPCGVTAAHAGARGAVPAGVVFLLVAVAGAALVIVALRLAASRRREDLLRACDASAAELGRVGNPSALGKAGVDQMVNRAATLDRMLKRVSGLRKDAESTGLSPIDRQRIDGLARASREACAAVAKAASALAEGGAATPGAGGAPADVDKLLQSLLALERNLRGAEESASGDAEASKALADAAGAVKAWADECARVETTTFDDLFSRLSDEKAPMCASELELWRSNRQRFFFSKETYETDRLTYSTTTRVTGRVGYNVVTGGGPSDEYVSTWRGLFDALGVLKADLAAAKAEGDVSDEQVESFSERATALAGRVQSELDAPPERYLVLRSADASDFDEKQATTVVQEGETPRPPWEIPPSVFDSAFSAFGCTLPQVEAAIEKIAGMSKKPVDLEQELPELKPPMGLPLFAEPTPQQRRLADRYNDYVRIFNAELRRRTRVGLDAWLEDMAGLLAETAPEKAFTRLTVRCRAVAMPDLVRKGLAKALGREPAPFVLVESGKPAE